MASFSQFDSRGYRSVDLRTGYREWAATYEDTVQDAMDLALLDELRAPAWRRWSRVADLGCGTGRTAAWLRRHGAMRIDGVDVTPEMLAVARSRGGHDSLVLADVAETGLEGAAYDLVIASLVDEHLEDLGPLYREASRLATASGAFVLVALHPHFMMLTGMPTHFTSAAGEPLALPTHLHLVSHHVTAGLGAGWRLTEMREAVVDERWLAVKPKWQPYRGHPVSMALAWRKPA